MSIPPRPWRVEEAGDESGDIPLAHVFSDDEPILQRRHVLSFVEQPTADLIVRLVNAEPEIVAALEAAERLMVDNYEEGLGHAPATTPESECEACQELRLVRVALAKVRP